MGFWDDLTGKSAANAATAAAQKQYAGEQQAINRLYDTGQQYATNVGALASNYDPYRNAGTGALNQLLGGLGLGGPGGGAAFTNAYQSLPGYQSGLETGTNAAIRGLNAGGRLASGATLKGLQRFGSDYENQRVGDYMNRLAGLGQLGYGATNAATGVQQAGYGGQLQAGLGAGQEAFRSAGTIPQGDVAAATAQMQGAQGLFNTGANLLGSFLGGGGGFGSGLSSGLGFGNKGVGNAAGNYIGTGLKSLWG
jgi:hypothetical protein